MGLFFGLLSALGYGAGDLLARVGSRRIGAVRTLYFMQFVGLIGLGAYLLLSGDLARAAADTPLVIWIVAVLTAGLNIAASLMLYQALRVGAASIVSPVVSSYGALTVPIALLVGEQIPALALVGLLVVIVGVALSSLGRSEAEGDGKANRGIGLAIASSFGYAGVFALFGFVLTPVLGGIMPVWVSRVTCVTLFTVGFLLTRTPFNPPRDRMTLLAVLGVGVLDTVGFTAYAIGTTGDSVAIVSVLSSLFAAVTVLLAWIFLQERPRPIQWTGIAAIFIGLILVSAPG